MFYTTNYDIEKHLNIKFLLILSSNVQDNRTIVLEHSRNFLEGYQSNFFNKTKFILSRGLANRILRASEIKSWKLWTIQRCTNKWWNCCENLQPNSHWFSIIIDFYIISNLQLRTAQNQVCQFNISWNNCYSNNILSADIRTKEKMTNEEVFRTKHL